MTLDHLREAVRELRRRKRDTWDIEVKRAAGGVPDVCDTLSAFANMPDGGTIIFGLDEAEGFSVVPGIDVQAVHEKVGHWARAEISPPIQVNLWDALIDNHPVVVASVPPLAQHLQPARVRPNGPAYTRSADGDYPLSEAEVQQILARRERPRHDLLPVDDTGRDDLDPELTRAFIDRIRRTSTRLRDEDDLTILRARRVIENRGDRLTIAGLYALGWYPQSFFPQFTITAVRRRAGSGVRNEDREEFEGPIPVLLHDAVDWVMRNIRTTVREGADGHLYDEAEMPAVAVRELIANALVHRDLSPHATSKDVTISLDSSKLVIASPGGLWGVTLDRLGRPGGKSAVNEHLYDLCQVTTTADGQRVIEGEGGGLREVHSSLLNSGMQPPKLHSNPVSFTAIIPRESLLSDADLAWLAAIPGAGQLSRLQKSAAVAMRHGREWTNQQIRDEFGPLDSVHAREELQGLVSAGIATADGERRGTRYRLASALCEPDVDVSEGVSGAPVDALSPAVSTATDPHAIRDDVDQGNSSHAPRTSSIQGVTALFSNLSRNALPIYEAISPTGSTTGELSRKTGLAGHQVRYALKDLQQHDLVRMEGGRGKHGTLYRHVD